jgi:hypothetical protein
LENLLEKESRKTRAGHSKEIKKALFTLYPILHPCCLLREVRGKIERTRQEKISGGKMPNNQLANYLSQELSNQQKSRVEKIEGIVNFCLDYLNQDIKED